MLSLEGNDCFGPGKIAELADTYVSNHDESDKPRRTAHVAQVKVVQSPGLPGPIGSNGILIIPRMVIGEHSHTRYILFSMQ